MRHKRVWLAMTAVSGFNMPALAAPTVEYAGLVEIEAFTGEDASDITVATVELGTEVKLNEPFSGVVALLYEEDETDIEIDVATVVYDLNEQASITGGQDYMPFGVFNSHMIAEPLTQELAETRATAVKADFATGPLVASLYTFNGPHVDEGLDNWGATLAFESERLAVSLGYIANLGDSDTLAAETIADEVPGVSIGAGLLLGNFTLIGEYLTAQDEFQPGDGNTDHVFTAASEPEAYQIEAAYLVGPTSFAASLQQTKDATDLGLPEKRTSLGVSHDLYANTHIALEWAADEAYTGEDSDTITIQLAVEL